VPLKLTLTLCAALGILVAGGCAASGAIVMASGRDDHGLLAKPAVALQRSPTDLAVTGSVPDGGFLRVVQQDRAWFYVRTIAEPSEEGWVNDHDLRPVAVLTTQQLQVRFRDARWRDGRVEILVSPVASAGAGDAIWVGASELKEVGAR
jgi:hypothetical protein